MNECKKGDGCCGTVRWSVVGETCIGFQLGESSRDPSMHSMRKRPHSSNAACKRSVSVCGCGWVVPPFGSQSAGTNNACAVMSFFLVPDRAC